MRIRIGFAVTLALVVVLALGTTGTSAAPAAAASENAVVYWSGVAEVAIAAGRPPASSTPLAAMVHGAMYDAVAAIEGGLEPFATGVTAPPEASADAAVAQAARDVLVARVPGQAAAVQVAYDTFMAAIPAGIAKDGGKAVGTASAAGMLAMRTGDHFDDVVPYVQPTPGPGVFEPIAPTTPVDVKLGKVRPFTFDVAVHVPAGLAVRADEQALCTRRQRAQGDRRRRQREDAVPDRARPLLLRSGVRPVQPCPARRGRRPRARPA